MNEGVTLEEDDWLRFARAVEGSFLVGSRPQFFVWTQSSVQAVVPHEILLCSVRDAASQSMLSEHFSATRYFRAEHFSALADARGGLLPLLLQASQSTGDPIVFCPEGGSGPLAELVADNELKSLAAMLVEGVDGQVQACYVFARVEAPLDGRLHRLMSLVVPHLHSAFVRLVARERESLSRTEQAGERLITRRQAEILMLVKDGKTNAEIADLLACSQWTIKNHIQNILRRLNTNSRAHAIVVAMRKGILRPD